MASDPKCPDCDGPISADWDWCLHCGYDPDHLKPWDWRPDGATAGSVQTATAPRRVDTLDLTDRKRMKRSARPKRRGRKKAAEEPEAKPATMASTSGLISLPPRPSVPDARKPPMPPKPPTDPARRTDPAPPGVPVGPAAAPAAAAPPAPPAAPAPAPAPAPTPEPAFDMTSPLVHHTYTPAVPALANRTVTLPRTSLSLVPVFVLYLLSALMLFVAFSSMAKLGEGSALSRATTVLFVLVCLALACGMAAQGYTFSKVRVEIGPTEIVAHNRFGRPSRARIRDIFSITMGTRRYLDLPLVGRPAEAPYVQVQDGSGFWLDALEGRDGEPPNPEQMAVIDALTRTVAANRDEARRDDPSTNRL